MRPALDVADDFVGVARPCAAGGTTSRPSARRDRRTVNRARSRTVEWRPSQPTDRSARISSSPSGVLARTPTTRPSSSIRSVASVSHAQIEGSDIACRARRGNSRKSHCGISAMNLQCVGSMSKSPMVTRSSPICMRDVVDLLMRQLEELVEQAELVHHLQRRGMHGVAAEIAQEVGVLFQHRHRDAGARQQKAEHHAGRPAAGDAAGGLDRMRTPSGVLTLRSSPRMRDPRGCLAIAGMSDGLTPACPACSPPGRQARR